MQTVNTVIALRSDVPLPLSGRTYPCHVLPLTVQPGRVCVARLDRLNPVTGRAALKSARDIAKHDTAQRQDVLVKLRIPATAGQTGQSLFVATPARYNNPVTGRAA